MGKKIPKNGVYKVSKRHLNKIITALRSEGNIYVAEIDAFNLGQSYYNLSRYYGIPPEFLKDNPNWIAEVDFWPSTSGWLEKKGCIGYAIVLRNAPVDEDDSLRNYYRFVARHLQGNIELWHEGKAVPYNAFIELPLSMNFISVEKVIDSYRNFKIMYLDDPEEKRKQLTVRAAACILIAAYLVFAFFMLKDNPDILFFR